MKEDHNDLPLGGLSLPVGRRLLFAKPAFLPQRPFYVGFRVEAPVVMRIVLRLYNLGHITPVLTTWFVSMPFSSILENSSFDKLTKEFCGVANKHYTF